MLLPQTTHRPTRKTGLPSNAYPRTGTHTAAESKSAAPKRGTKYSQAHNATPNDTNGKFQRSGTANEHLRQPMELGQSRRQSRTRTQMRNLRSQTRRRL